MGISLAISPSALSSCTYAPATIFFRLVTSRSTFMCVLITVSGQTICEESHVNVGRFTADHLMILSTNIQRQQHRTTTRVVGSERGERRT
uniref:Secreted protein n=1 Tax=Parascaris equorum TaxID=6256 RepID=A0A914S439_PAREQ